MNDIRISGSGNVGGGEYENVKISGSGRVDGDISCKIFRLQDLQKLTATRFAIAFRHQARHTYAEALNAAASCAFREALRRTVM